VLDYCLKDRASSAIQLENSSTRKESWLRRFASDGRLAQDKSKTTCRFKWSGCATRSHYWLRRECTDSSGIFVTAAAEERFAAPSWGPAGQLAVPGNYIVKLTANGKSSTQPLTIKLDPRVKNAAGCAHAGSFGLASRLAARLGEVSLGVAAGPATSESRSRARKKDAIDSAELQKALRGLEEKVEAAVEPDSDADFGLFWTRRAGQGA